MLRWLTIGAASFALAACDGAREEAGEKADIQSGAVKKGDFLTSGPAETMGERQDQAKAAAEDAREARADALEKQADAQRRVAEEKAEALEQQADKVRGK